MKLGDANYDSTVEQKRTELRGHKHTQLTESECKQEIEAIVGGAKSTFADGTMLHYLPGDTNTAAPKKRGRPKGSLNRPKEPK